MNTIDTAIAKDTASDPEMLIVFLHYALEDVRKFSQQSATLLERAIATLVNEVETTLPRSLS